MLKHLINSDRDAFAIPRKRWLDIFATVQTELSAYPDVQVRFYKNKKQFVWKRELHEYFDGAAVASSKDIVGSELHINHFHDVFKDQKRLLERQELYSKLAKTAGVEIEGGKEL